MGRRQRSCKLIVTNPESRAATVDAHVPAVGRKPGGGKAVRKPEARRVARRSGGEFYGNGRDESPLDGVVRWAVNRMVGGGKDKERCAVGSSTTPRRGSARPFAGRGVRVRPSVEKCVSADITDRLPL